MSARRLRAHVLLLALGLLAAAGAIVIRHDRPDAAYRELAAGYPSAPSTWAVGVAAAR